MIYSKYKGKLILNKVCTFIIAAEHGVMDFGQKDFYVSMTVPPAVVPVHSQCSFTCPESHVSQVRQLVIRKNNYVS